MIVSQLSQYTETQCNEKQYNSITKHSIKTQSDETPKGGARQMNWKSNDNLHNYYIKSLIC